MKAVVFSQFGNSEVLNLAEVKKPEIQHDEVLIKISHTAVNPVDWKIREGYLSDMFPHHFPIVPGWDASGVIEAVGSEVKNLKVGDQVYAYARKPEVQEGTYAEYISLKADAVSMKPRNITSGEAASIPLVGLTAWQSLFDFAKLQEGETVYITGGSGGVGSLAIQFAKLVGAKVITAASEKNHAYLQELGADQVIDYTLGNLAEQVKQHAKNEIDVVFDTVGGDSLKAGFEVIKKGGRLVSIVDTPDEKLSKARDVEAGFVFVAPNGEQLATIAAEIERGSVKVPAIEEMSVKEAAEAQKLSQNHHVKGKIVLAIDF